jgi:hypothetical protein
MSNNVPGFLDLTAELINNSQNTIGLPFDNQQGSVQLNPDLLQNQQTQQTNQVSINNVSIYLEKNLLDVLLAAAEKHDSTLDTESFYESNDLLSEGPIEGLSDQDGNTLNYIGLNSSVQNKDSSLAFGVYYNDVAVKDKKTNLLNLSAADFSLSLGDEINNFTDISSCVYKYDSRVYDLDFDPKIEEISSEQQKLIAQEFTNKTQENLYIKSMHLRNIARSFSHYVKNKYATSATVNVKIDSCFRLNDDGSAISNNVRFVISVTNVTERTVNYFFFQGYFVVKNTPVVLPFQIKFNRSANLASNFPEYLINVYSVEKRLTSSDTRNKSRSFSIDSVVERVDLGFSYPYSALCRNIVSAKHFSNIPVRSFDCKLLKVNVPNNYDSDVKEYIGDWNGNFSKTIRWTDNPAWIFYDLCINSRYGLAKTSLSENDLNKWELYKISKFCDELVITNASTKYKEDTFLFDNSLSIDETDYNTITFTSTEDISVIKSRYPEKSIIYLYDVKNTFGESINENFKKIILSVTKSSNTVKIKLCNDFGVRKFIESDFSGRFYESLRTYILSNPSVLNTEDNAKNFAVSYIDGFSNPVNSFNSASEQVSVSFRNRRIFDSSLNVYSGKCVAKHPDYPEFLEPRFSANIYINDTTEGLKILTDLSSVFRGIFYFKNGLLSLNTDVKKATTYVFTNSNVKNGFFNYASSNLESSYSVVKVSYLDKLDNFKDKIVYVEDSDLIKKYGLIEKEILGFGITSKFQAERIGKWFLTTGKLESQTVSFNTGIEASLLKIGDVVRIADNLKNSNVLFGKILSLDFKNNYIYIDREMKSDVLGKRIKLLSVINDETVESTFTVFENDNSNLRLVILPYDFLSWNLKNKTKTSFYGRNLSADGLSVAAWNKKAFSKQSYVENCQLSFKVETPNDIMVVGISSKNNITNDYTDIEYGFYVNSGNLLGIFSGYSFASPYNFNKTISATDILSIVYDGINVSFYLNKELLTDGDPRSIGDPLYASVAFNGQFASINEISYSRYPLPSYSSFSNLRSDANFSIYLSEEEEKEDLYRIVGITENSTNEYGISAIKYNEEKFDVVDKNAFIDENQYNKKQIIFSTTDYVSPAFSDSVISANIKQYTLSYIQSINLDFDYSFVIETEVLNDNFNMKNYISIEIDFDSLFQVLSSNQQVYGLFCSIIKDGKVLKFKKTKNQSGKISIFLGQSSIGLNSNSVIFDIDLYAFDSDLKLINV